MQKIGKKSLKCMITSFYIFNQYLTKLALLFCSFLCLHTLHTVASNKKTQKFESSQM